MTITTTQPPAVVRAASLPDSIKVEPLTCAIGAELSNVNLGVASRDPALVQPGPGGIAAARDPPLATPSAVAERGCVTVRGFHGAPQGGSCQT